MIKLQEIKQRLLISDFNLYRYGSLPPRVATFRLITAQLQGTSPVIFTWTLPEAEALVASVYDDDTPTSPMAMAEVCVLAVGGTHYDESHVSEWDRAIYYASAISYLQAHARPQCLRTMRLLLGLVLFLMLEKNEHVRCLLCESSC